MKRKGNVTNVSGLMGAKGDPLNFNECERRYLGAHRWFGQKKGPISSTSFITLGNLPFAEIRSLAFVSRQTREGVRWLMAYRR